MSMRNHSRVTIPGSERHVIPTYIAKRMPISPAGLVLRATFTGFLSLEIIWSGNSFGNDHKGMDFRQ